MITMTIDDVVEGLTWSFNHAPTMWRSTMVAENLATIGDHAGHNFQVCLIFCLMEPASRVLRTFGMTAGEVVVSINRETFPHKSEPGGIKMCRKMPWWHSSRSVAAAEDRLTGETKYI